MSYLPVTHTCIILCLPTSCLFVRFLTGGKCGSVYYNIELLTYYYTDPPTIPIYNIIINYNNIPTRGCESYVTAAGSKEPNIILYYYNIGCA